MNKKANFGQIFSILVFLILLALIGILVLYIFSPSLLPSSATEAVENTATELEEFARGIEGENIPELSTKELPLGVHPNRNLYLLELEIFNEMNEQRSKRSLPSLEWNEAVANTAFKHSFEMSIYDYVNHSNNKGLLAGDRLLEDRIFNLCNSENIFFIESNNPTFDLAKKSVEGWLNSPGHRKNLLDPEISKAGVGVSCEGRKCYVNANHICTTNKLSEDLNRKFVYFFSLYPDSYELDITTKVEFEIDSTSDISLFIIPSKTEYDNFVNRKSYSFTKKYSDVNSIKDVAVVGKGYGFMVVPTKDSTININVDYT